jgi:hypothetical protein
MELQHAFKEWAVICRALAEGKQALLLRKGGIAETGGDFAVEHTRFWLFPTYTHQQAEGVRPDAAPLLREAEADKPAAGTVALSHLAEVTGTYRVHDLTAALLLAHLHFWSEDTVRKRFAYRVPGINVLTVRVYRAAAIHTVVDTARYQGCKSWVDLDKPLPRDGSAAVLTDKEYNEVKWHLDMLLNPTATA